MTTVGRTGIDPRIRQRRIDVRRATGRKRLHRLLALVVVLGLFGAGVLATMSPLLDVDRISVAGAQATPASEIVAAADIAEGDPMVRIDVDAATAVLEALPWVDTARIRRDFPSDVRIEITEREPVGIVRAGSGEALVDATGRVLGPMGRGFGDLPRIEVAGELPAPGGTLDAPTVASLGLVAAVGDEIEGHTVVVVPGTDGSTSLRLDDAITVALGDADRIETKLRSAATVLDQVDLTCVEVIDVRIADRPVLTRNEPCR